MKKAAPSLPHHPDISRVIRKAIKLACTRTSALQIKPEYMYHTVCLARKPVLLNYHCRV
jgi:hypothetical protein